MYTWILYSFGLVHSSIWAKTWLVNEVLMTNDECPMAHPKLTNLPSAKTTMRLPLGNVYLSTYVRIKFKIIPLFIEWERLGDYIPGA